MGWLLDELTVSIIALYKRPCDQPMNEQSSFVGLSHILRCSNKSSMEKTNPTNDCSSERSFVQLFNTPKFGLYKGWAPIDLLFCRSALKLLFACVKGLLLKLFFFFVRNASLLSYLTPCFCYSAITTIKHLKKDVRLTSKEQVQRY